MPLMSRGKYLVTQFSQERLKKIGQSGFPQNKYFIYVRRIGLLITQ